MTASPTTMPSASPSPVISTRPPENSPVSTRTIRVPPSVTSWTP